MKLVLTTSMIISLHCKVSAKYLPEWVSAKYLVTLFIWTTELFC